MDMKQTTRRAFVAAGQVQGVGFRPFVYRLAREGRLTGTVGNTSDGVRMEVQGAPEEVARFGRRLRAELPPLARLTGLDEEELPPLPGETAFAIVPSHGHARIWASARTASRTCAIRPTAVMAMLSPTAPIAGRATPSPAPSPMTGPPPP